MNHALWSGLIGGAIAIALNSWLTRRDLRLGATRLADGWRAIHYGPAYKIVAIIIAAIALFLVLAASRAVPEQRLAAMLVGCALGAGAIGLLYVVFLHTVRFNVSEIQSVHPGLTRSIPFADIVDARFVRGLGCVRVVGGDGRGIWIFSLGGVMTLSRYGRRLERMLVLDRLLRRRHIELAEFGSDARSIAAALALSMRMGGARQTFVEVSVARDWTAGETDTADGRAVVVLVADGDARLTARKHVWSMTPGDVVRVPAGFADTVTIASVGSEPARLIVLHGREQC